MEHLIPLSQETEARPKPVGKISYKEFLELYDGIHAEWVDGEVEMGSPVSTEHSDDSGFLESLLRIYVEENDLGKVLSAPVSMRIQRESRGREPDLMFISKTHLDRIKLGYIDGPSDLAIEIISPESVGRDRGDKFVEYEAAGIREYWLIDPQRKQAEFYTLDDGHQYQLILSGKEGRFESRVVPEFYLQVEWLWQKPLPKVVPLLRQMGIL